MKRINVGTKANNFLKRVHEVIAAVVFWMFLLLVLALLLPLAAIALLVTSSVWWLIRILLDNLVTRNNYSWLNRSNHDSARHDYVQQQFPPNTSVENIDIDIEGIRSDLTIHVSLKLIKCKCNKSSKDSLFILHGVGSSAALMTSSSMSFLSKNFNIYAVDIPGFDGSNMSYSLCDLTADETMSFYEVFFQKVVTELNLPSPPWVIAHSLGSFLAVEAFWKLPQDSLIKGIVLVNAAGLLPIESVMGGFYAVLFKSGVPMSIFRILGTALSSFLTLPLMSLTGANKSARMKYWIQVQSAIGTVNVCSKYLKMRPFSAYWSRPTLPKVLLCENDVGFLWGTHDSVTPIHTAYFLLKLGKILGKKYVLHPVEDVGHSPFHVNGGAVFADGLNAVIAKLEALKLSKNAKNEVRSDSTESSDGAVTPSQRNRKSTVNNHPRQRARLRSGNGPQTRCDNDKKNSKGLSEQSAALLLRRASFVFANMFETEREVWCASFSTFRTRRRIFALHSKLLHMAVDLCNHYASSRLTLQEDRMSLNHDGAATKTVASADIVDLAAALGLTKSQVRGLYVDDAGIVYSSKHADSVSSGGTSTRSILSRQQEYSELQLDKWDA